METAVGVAEAVQVAGILTAVIPAVGVAEAVQVAALTGGTLVV